MNKNILDAYTNPAEPGAFSALSGFAKNHKFKRDDINKILGPQEAVQVHKPFRKRYPRN